jgi:hypothetical protein
MKVSSRLHWAGKQVSVCHRREPHIHVPKTAPTSASAGSASLVMGDIVCGLERVGNCKEKLARLIRCNCEAAMGEAVGVAPRRTHLGY